MSPLSALDSGLPINGAALLTDMATQRASRKRRRPELPTLPPNDNHPAQSGPFSRAHATTRSALSTVDADGFSKPALTATHSDYAGALEIKEAADVQSTTRDSYKSYWLAFTTYCAANNWDPFAYSYELALLFFSKLSKRRTPRGPLQSIDGYCAALNYHYKNNDDRLADDGSDPMLGQPWAGGRITKLKKGFQNNAKKIAQREAVANGTHVRLGSLRIAVPETTCMLMLDKSKKAVLEYKQAKITPGYDAAALYILAETCAWFAIFWLMLIFGFRADTMAGIGDAQKDIIVTPDTKELRFTVRRVKRGNTVLRHFPGDTIVRV